MSLARNLSLYGVADVLGSAFALAVSPITTRLLTRAQYGVLPLLDSLWGVVALARFAGMDAAYPFFRARPEADEQKALATASVLAASATFIVGVGFCIVALATTLVSSMAGTTSGELHAYLLGLLPMSWMQWHLYVLRYGRHAAGYARTALLRRVFGPLSILPVLFWIPQQDRLIVWLGGYSLASLVALIWSFRELSRAGLNPYRKEHRDPVLGREMLHYGLVLVPAGAIYSLVTLTDRVLVGALAGTEEVAVLSLGVGIGSLILMLKRSFLLAFDPALTEWLAREEPQVYLARLNGVIVVVGLLFVPASMLLTLWIAPLISWLYPPQYEPMSGLVPVVALSATVSVFSLIAVASAYLRQARLAHLPLYSAGLITNVAVGLALIPSMGALGAALGTAAAESVILLGWVAMGRLVYKNLPLRWGPAFLALALLSALVLCVVTESFPLEGLRPRVISSLLVLSGTVLAAHVHRPLGEWKSTLLSWRGRDA